MSPVPPLSKSPLGVCSSWGSGREGWAPGVQSPRFGLAALPPGRGLLPSSQDAPSLTTPVLVGKQTPPESHCCHTAPACRTPKTSPKAGPHSHQLAPWPQGLYRLLKHCPSQCCWTLGDLLGRAPAVGDRPAPTSTASSPLLCASLHGVGGRAMALLIQTSPGCCCDRHGTLTPLRQLFLPLCPCRPTLLNSVCAALGKQATG